MVPRHARLRGGGEGGQPKRKALAEAEASLAATLAALKEKQFLKDVQDKVAQLEKDLAKAEAESQSLKDQAQLTDGSPRARGAS